MGFPLTGDGSPPPTADRQRGTRPDPKNEFENPLGAPLHGELLKLGIEVAQSTVSTYMVPRRDRPSQTSKPTFANMDGILIDLFVVPTIAFTVLSPWHRRRQLVAVTKNSTADWLARQITEAFPWDSAPKYLIRDNDKVFGIAFKDRIRAMGIRDWPTYSVRPGRMDMLNARSGRSDASARMI